MWLLVDFFRLIGKDHHDRRFSNRSLDIVGVARLGTKPLARLALEARLLGGVSTIEIAGRLGVESSTIQDYCQIQFDVCDRLKARRWVIDKVIRPLPCPLARAVLRDSYFGRQDICEHWLSYLETLDDEHNLETEAGRESRRLWLRVEHEKLAESSAERLNQLLQSDRHLLHSPPPRTVGQTAENYMRRVLIKRSKTMDTSIEMIRRSGRTASATGLATKRTA